MLAILSAISEVIKENNDNTEEEPTGEPGASSGTLLPVTFKLF